MLIIAGSDSGGGAGIQADIKSASARGVYAATAITAITAQNTRGVRGVTVLPPDLVAAQIAAVLGDLSIDAVKIGMLGNAAVTRAVARSLDGYAGPVVVDPVMVAKSGDRLLDQDAETALIAHLLPRATLLTPNLPEAAALLQDHTDAKMSGGRVHETAAQGRGNRAEAHSEPGRREGAETERLDPAAHGAQLAETGIAGPRDPCADGATTAHGAGAWDPDLKGAKAAGASSPASSSMARDDAGEDPLSAGGIGARLLALGAGAVLVKGGHATGPVCSDLLVTQAGRHLFEAPRQSTRNTHGTGCSYASAITAELAKGQALPQAVAAAHGWLQGAIRAADGLGVGRGQGPVHHFHEVWQ
ncbi:hydroxymethylpyrimidine/phosphomethylpyrimidine kinase [Mesobaculum littorinae]|uniref:hydroxymethylpyrimidine kinase n=2 Tax=Mesobaculum littorinae TaxID=2486419 RepID=A0A438AMI8_9RHOB|nr:hydroxymethylpyrimidine/phosphomethylpyrimidine kinase [Mesobaculum littorinae]